MISMASNKGEKMLAAVGGSEVIALIFVFAFVGGIFGGWGLNIAALVRTVNASDEDFRRIGKTRGGQMALHIVGIVIYFMGAIVGWIWLFTTKKRLDGLSPLQAPPQSVQAGPGWWVASDGRWYPPQGGQLPPPPRTDVG